MHYIFYPNETIHKNKSDLKKGDIYVEYEDEGGYVGHEINELKKDKSKWFAYSLIVDILDKIANESDFPCLDAYYKTGYLKRLGDGISEIRKPKTDKRGVFRIYFCPSEITIETDIMVLLEAEFKKDDAEKIGSAKKLKIEYTNNIKRKNKYGGL